MEIIIPIEKSISIIFAICYLYQFFYTFYMLFTEEKVQTIKDFKMNKFGVIVAARNEEKVIGHLLDSIHNQTYPKELIKIFVIADNCTDNTAKISREKGAIVYERFNKQLVGKGYALDYLFKDLMAKNDDCDGYIVFDADNVVDKNYITEITRPSTSGLTRSPATAIRRTTEPTGFPQAMRYGSCANRNTSTTPACA